MKWAKEISLTDILSDEKYNDSDEIDETIDILQNIVSFHVPLLLKPIFDIKNPDSSFLTCMQSGAVNIATKAMINLGIARETAIYLNNALFHNDCVDIDNQKELENYIRTKLKQSLDSLPYWISVQYEYLV